MGSGWISEETQIFRTHPRKIGDTSTTSLPHRAIYLARNRDNDSIRGPVSSIGVGDNLRCGPQSGFNSALP